jgi:4-hydroxybenzoate polyprenyltransferase
MNEHLRVALISSRPVSWINTAYPFAAGYLVATRRLDLSFLLGTLYFLIPYNLMLYGVNDIFDYESDLSNPRKGGIEGAILKPAHWRTMWWLIAVANLPFLGYLLLQGDVVSKAWLLALVFLVLAYSLKHLRFKERPFLDSLTASSHFFGPLVYAWLIAGAPKGWWPALIAFCAWGMASHAFGAVQDVQADRAAGIGSIATVIGSRLTVAFALCLYLASAGLVIASYGTQGLIVGLALVSYAINLAPFLNLTDATAATANQGWRRFIYLNWVIGFVITQVLVRTFVF